MGIYRRGTGSRWTLVVYHQGRRIDRRFEGSRAEALAAEAQLRVDAQIQVLKPTGRAPTFESYVNRVYLAHARLHCAASTLTSRESMLKPMLEFFVSRLDRIETKDVEAYAQSRLKSGLRPSSVNNELRFLAAILNHALTGGHKVAAVVRQIPQKGVRRVGAWNQKQVEKLLAACQLVAPRILPLATFLANTGCRKGEGLWLRWENVDLEKRLIHLEPCEEWQPKSGRGRAVPVPAALLPYLRAERQDPVWVFPARVGGRWPAFPRRAFDKALAVAGLEGSPHKLRHSFASSFLRQRPDMYLLSQVLGHSDISITSRVYAHLLPDHLSAAMDVVNFEAKPSLEVAA